MCLQRKESKRNAMPSKLISNLTSPFKLQLYLFFKLPLAWFAGLRLEKLTEEVSMVSMTYGWRNQNPFKSMYFAALNMAGEFAPGSLCLVQAEMSEKNISFLVTSMEANFYKKAVGKIRFICNDGGNIKAAIQQAIATGEGVELWTSAQGFNAQYEMVAELKTQWSFKMRRSQS